MEIGYYSNGHQSYAAWRAVLHAEEGKAEWEIVEVDPISREVKVDMRVPITNKQFQRIKKEVSKAGISTLPSSDYQDGYEDDIYHMGVSLLIHHPRLGEYTHRTPTGPFVKVSTTRITSEQEKRFKGLVDGVLGLVKLMTQQQPPDCLYQPVS